MARQPIDRTRAHQLASEMLFGLFEGAICLENLTSTAFARNRNVHRLLVSVGKNLRSLRRELHLEFASRAGFSEVSPYASFEPKLEAAEKAASAQDPVLDGVDSIPGL